MGGLLVGFEPVGGDPDRAFRPIKSELASSLRQGRLPFWSDKIGLGIPLVAESQVAAFYPPNWPLYRFLTVPAAYRLSMWLHYVALAAATFAYARQIGAAPWGAALSAVAFTFCGFQTIHSSHEPFYHALPYLPLCLLAADKFIATGRWNWLGALGLLWGVQITLGHFQLQMWTAGLALVTGVWRVINERLPRRRIFGLVLALTLGLGVAAVQLVPSFELARMAGQLNRPLADLFFFSYPPDHLIELAVPALFRNLAEGPDGRYWFSQGTTGYEACLFVGTLPLILAIVAFVPNLTRKRLSLPAGIPGPQRADGAGGNDLPAGRGDGPWRVITILALGLAAMPQWWPTGYAYLLQIPGFGLFRCPARYTVITSLGLCLLAGCGFDRAISARRFGTGLTIAGLFAVASFAWAFALPRLRPEFRPNLDDAALALRVCIAGLTWVAAMSLLWIWRRKPGSAWILFVMTAMEVGAFYHLAGTTHWGRSAKLPEASSVLSLLAKEPEVGLISGPFGDLPLSAGLTTGSPYTGFTLPMPNMFLKELDPREVASSRGSRWLRRYGVTHLVWDEPLATDAVDEIFHGDDFVLDELAHQKPGVARRDWRVYRLRDDFPPVRLGLRVHEAPDLRSLIEVLSSRDGLDEAWYLTGEAPAPLRSPPAETAKIVEWDGLSGAIEHAGAVELVLCRAHYPGWEVTIDDDPPRPALRSNGGLLTARLDGDGVSRVSFRYRPNGMTAAVAVSAAAILVCLALAGMARRKARSILVGSPQPARKADLHSESGP
jgi:hypothetical protein